MESINVKGQQFEIPSRYQEGHELTAGEAAKMQREYKKVLDVWLRKKVANGGLADDIQTELDAYATRYQFGQRIGGGPRVKDPIMVKALELAKDHIRKKFKQAGGRLKDLKQGKINAKAREWVADPDRGYMDLAKKELKKAAPQQTMIDDDIADLLLS